MRAFNFGFKRMNRSTRFLRCIKFLFVLVATSTFAQSEYSMRGSNNAPDIALPTQPTDIATVQAPSLAIYKPVGDGPFPALVLLHQCGGLGSPGGSWQNVSILEWAREAVGRGYVVLQLDSFGPRGVRSVCLGPDKEVFPSRGMRDALLAAAHLRKLSYVDPKRVAFAGFSWGGAIGLAVSSRQSSQALGVTDRYDAVASFYPPCVARPKTGAPYTVIMGGIDRPLLVLLAGRDNEAPPQECTERLTLAKANGAPTEWHVFSDATHCWDCKNLHGFKKVDIRGSSVEYLYDEAVTRDSANRMFGFFEKAFAGSK
jgi:dienelactone hydrolase